MATYAHESYNTYLIISTEKDWRDDRRCGSNFLLENGKPAECEPNANAEKEGPCCNLDTGWCGNSNSSCECTNCINYASGEKQNMLCQMCGIFAG